MKKVFTNKIFLLVILVLLFVLVSSLEGNSFFKKDKEKEVVVNTEIEKNEEAGDIQEETIIEEIQENQADLPSITPTADVMDQPGSSIGFLVYPNSKIISQNNSQAVLESDASTDEITDWYKGKIDEYDMNVTSTVKTNTNGNVLNKLSAAGSNLKVEIEISRSNSDSLTKITAKLL